MKSKTCRGKQIIEQKYNVRHKTFISLIGMIGVGNFRHYIVIVGKALFSPLHILLHKLLPTPSYFLVYNQVNTI